MVRLTQDALESISASDWEACCRHVREQEERFWRTNVAMERAVEQFIIAVSDEEATDTASDDQDYSDTDSAFET